MSDMKVASPRTPTARKAPAGATLKKSRSSGGTPATRKKRKLKCEISPTPCPASKSKSVAKRIPKAESAPQKKQKVKAHPKTETLYHTPPEKKDYNPSRHQQPTTVHDASINTTTGKTELTRASFDDMFVAAISNAPHLLPIDSPSLTSSHIDAIANAMWSNAVSSGDGRGDHLNAVQKYVILFDEVKLRILARLDLLPSWWFFRERIVLKLANGGWTVDDGVMRGVLMQAKKECEEAVANRKRVLGLRGGGGGGA